MTKLKIKSPQKTKIPFLVKNYLRQTFKKRPKPIMTSQISDMPPFTNKFLSTDRFKFETNLIGNFTRVLPETMLDKILLHEHFKQNNIQD